MFICLKNEQLTFLSPSPSPIFARIHEPFKKNYYDLFNLFLEPSEASSHVGVLRGRRGLGAHRTAFVRLVIPL